MKRTRLRCKCPKNKCAATKKTYISQRKLCVSIVKKAKWDYFNKLDHKKLNDNKTFWKTVKPLLTDKGSNNEKILLIEESETFSNDKKISKKLNNLFGDAVKNADIPFCEDPSVNNDHIKDPIIKFKEKFKNHQNIKSIKTANYNRKLFLCPPQI